MKKSKSILTFALCLVLIAATGISGVSAQTSEPIWEDLSFWEDAHFYPTELLRMQGYTLHEIETLQAEGKVNEVAYLIYTFADTQENIRAAYITNTTENAAPTASTIFVNSKEIVFDAYNIGGYNYFKLRDVAYALSDTAAPFDVAWNEANNRIELTSGTSYTVVGGEMQTGSTGNKIATPTSSKITLNGSSDELSLQAYNINNNNYFKLRDIGRLLNFSVDWDSARNAILIDTSKGTELPFIFHGTGRDAADNEMGIFVLIAADGPQLIILDFFIYRVTPHDIVTQGSERHPGMFNFMYDMMFYEETDPKISVDWDKMTFNYRQISLTGELTRITKAEFERLVEGTGIVEKLETDEKSSYNYVM